MDAPLRAVTRSSGRRPWWIVAAVFLLPLAGALWLGALAAVDASGWQRLAGDSQFGPALALAMGVGIASTLLAIAATLALVTGLHGTRLWQRVQAALGVLLAVPHAAFAIGLALLVMPSGLIARLVAPLAGWTSPPDVATVNDPWGIALIAGLVLKEVPFLLWNVAAQLQRVGQGAELRKQLQVAATMGYGPRSAWVRVLWPQLLPRLVLPLLAVWGYSLTVVDMALVLGPASPPTLAVLAWQWLLDADPAVQAQGAAAAWLLAAIVAAGALAAHLAWRALRAAARRRWTRGDRPAPRPSRTVRWAGGGALLYAAVLAVLAFVSFAGLWTFPDLSPQQWTLDAWQTVFAGTSTLRVTALLAFASAATGLVLSVAWMETSPPHWDARVAPAVFAPMLVPGVLLAAGLHQLTLHAGVDGRLGGLWLAHSVYTTPYVLVALVPAYRGFDRRYEQTAQALGRAHLVFLWRVKWPMLLAPLAAAFAIGFAVSVAQYLPTQFVGGGRHATVTTEAVTLASGGQRQLGAAFALLQALLPAVVFMLAAAIAQAQRRRLAA